MPYPKTPWIVERQIKVIMLKYKSVYGIEITAKGCLAKLQAWEASEGLKDILPISWKTVQKFMTKWREQGIYEDVEKHGLEHTFLLGQSLGEGANQIPWKYAGRAREISELYLTYFGKEPEIGLIRQYIRVSQIDLEWTDVQQKSLMAEIFWANELLADTDLDAGSIRYHELQMIFQTWKNTNDHASFQKVIKAEGVVPWSATVSDDVLAMAPQFYHVAKRNSPIKADTKVGWTMDEEPLPEYDPSIEEELISNSSYDFNKSEATEDSYMKSREAFMDAGNYVFNDDSEEPEIQDDFEPPLPPTYESDAPPLVKIEYDQDGKPIKPWEKNK